MAVTELPSVAVFNWSHSANAFCHTAMGKRDHDWLHARWWWQCRAGVVHTLRISTTLSGTTISVRPEEEKAAGAQGTGQRQVSGAPTGRPEDRKGLPLGK